MDTANAGYKKDPANLGIAERMMMFRGILDPEYFNRSVRPRLFAMAYNDAEKVQELVIEILRRNNFSMSMASNFFPRHDELKVKVAGKEFVPFGTAAGLDKNGEAMLALSHFFGFLEPGTVVLNPRTGNDRPRLIAVDKDHDLYNAQGFPSKGLEYFMNNIMQYRKSKGKAPVYADICGLPLSEQNAVQVAMDEMRVLLQRIEPYVDGFVWDPASPNTAALSVLKTPEIFEQTAQLMKQLSKNKLNLVKMWPYEPAEKDASLKFVESFINGGGHGVVTSNTKMFPKEQIPAPNWGYKSAGRSGSFLKEYRLRSVRDMRAAFPDAVIVATGGINDGDDAYKTFEAGADMLEGYTPYTFYGLGLLRQLEEGVARNLKANGYDTLAHLQADVKEGKHLSMKVG